MVSQLEVVRDNLRQLIQKRNAHAATATASRERHYG